MPSFSRFLLPGSLLNAVTFLLAIFVVVIATAFTITVGYLHENWIVLHSCLTVFSALILKITLHHDPRKPLADIFWHMYERNFCIFLHILEEIVLYLWLWSIKIPKLDYQVTVENVAIFALIIFRFICFMWFYYKELYEEYELSVTFAAGTDFLYLLVKTCIILTALQKSNQDFVDFLMGFYKNSYPTYTVFILAVFCGLYRESVRQLPVQVQAPVQIPQPVVLASGELERAPPPELEEMV
jgi:hypothetical protein